MQLPERNTQSAIALAQTRRMKDGRFFPQTQGRKLRQETCRNMSNYVELCRNMSNYVELWLNYVEICRNICFVMSYVKNCRNCQVRIAVVAPRLLPRRGKRQGRCRAVTAMPCHASKFGGPWSPCHGPRHDVETGDRSKFGDGMWRIYRIYRIYISTKTKRVFSDPIHGNTNTACADLRMHSCVQQ